MNLDSALVTLVEEARELLDAMEQALLAIEASGSTPDAVNAIFRAAHTIKGSAGLFGLDQIVSFTHVAESALDRVRSGELAMNAALVSLLLDCGDYLGRMINAVEANVSTEPDPIQREALLAELSSYLSEAAPVAGAAAADNSVCVNAYRQWRIALRPSADVLRNGMDPLSFIRYLQTLGTVTAIATITDALPLAAAMDAETCYLGFDIAFESDATQQQIENVFEFIREDSHIAVEALAPVVAEPELVDSNANGSVMSAEAVDKPLADKKVQEAKFIKIDIAKLDQLINLVGELVTASAAANLAAHLTCEPNARETADTVIDLVEQIRDNALSLRMVPIGEVFARFPRVVRDVAKDLGKQIELKITGADTELDKSMVEKLVDPLMHCVRNAMDHGIENVDERRAAGKSDTGTLRLTAYQESGSIMIEIADDGRGMDTARIRNKAIERGLISADAELSHKEILNLIFAPGFSTAAAVTNISGRGVGMDVVKKNIEALRGEVELASEFGTGSTIRIRLPLTLAIIDGFRVQVDRSDFVIPLDLITECIDLDRDAMHHDLIRLRDEALPIVSLRELFQLKGAAPSRENLVVVQAGQTRVGIVVDRLVGELQAVIKPLGEVFRHTRSISGTTILGNGDVALLLDVQQVVQAATQSRSLH